MRRNAGSAREATRFFEASSRRVVRCPRPSIGLIRGPVLDRSFKFDCSESRCPRVPHAGQELWGKLLSTQFADSLHYICNQFTLYQHGLNYISKQFTLCQHKLLSAQFSSRSRPPGPSSPGPRGPRPCSRSAARDRAGGSAQAGRRRAAPSMPELPPAFRVWR